MEDFIIQLQSKITGLEAERKKLQNFINEFNKQKINITAQVDTSSVKSANFTNIGKNAQQQFSKGFENASKKATGGHFGSSFQKNYLKDLEDTLEKSERLYQDNNKAFARMDELRAKTHRDATKAIQAEKRANQVKQKNHLKEAEASLNKELKLIENFSRNKANYDKQTALGNKAQANQLLTERKQIQNQMRLLRTEMKQYEDVYNNKAHKGILRSKINESQNIVNSAKAKIADDSLRTRTKDIIKSEQDIYKAKVKFQRMLNANGNADKKLLTDAKQYYDSLSKVNVSSFKTPQAKSLEVVKKLDAYTTNIVDSNRKNTAIIREQEKAQKVIQAIKNKEYKNYSSLKNNESARFNEMRREAYQSIGTKSPELQRMHNYYSNLEKNVKKYNRKIEQDRSTGVYRFRNQKYDDFLNTYDGQESKALTKVRQQISLAKTLQKELQTGKYQSGKNAGMRLIAEDQIAKAQRLETLVKNISNTMKIVESTSTKNLGFGVAEKSAAKVSIYMDKNTKALKRYGNELSDIQKGYAQATTVGQKKMLDHRFSTLKSKIISEGLTGKSPIDEFKRAFSQIGQFVGIYGVLQRLMLQAPRQIIQAVKAVDNAMVDLRMATGISNVEAKELMSTYVQMGKELKASSTDIAASATEWLKQGKSIEEANKLVKDSIVLSKIGGLSSGEATKTITAAMKSYDLSQKEVMTFVDQISAIDMASATDVGGLATAFNKVAANARAAGVETHKLLAYAATIGETTQQGMDTVGVALNAVFSRMGNIKLSRLKDPESNEDLSNVETSLRRVGIQLRESTGEFREFDDVIDDVASKWDSYNDVTKRSIAQSFAGTHHMNKFLVLMQNYSKAQDYMNIAMESSGESMKKYEAYQDSIAGRTEKLKAITEDFSTTLISSDFFKGMLDSGSGLLDLITKLIDKFGVLSPIIASVMTKSGLGILRYEKDLGFYSGFNKPRMGRADPALLAGISKNISLEAQKSGLVDWEGFIHNHDYASASLKGFLRDTTYSVKSMENFNAYLGKTTALSYRVGSAFKGLSANVLSFATNMLIITVVTKAIQVAYQAIDNYIHKSEIMIKKGKEASESIDKTFSSFSKGEKELNALGKSFAGADKEIKNTGDALDSVAEKYVTLSKGVNKYTNENKSLTGEEYKEYLNISTKLAEQFPTLISGYDEQGNAIVRMGDTALEASSKLRELYNSQMLTANAEIGKNLDDSIKGYMEQIRVYTNQNTDFNSKRSATKEGLEGFEKDIDASKLVNGNVFSFNQSALGGHIKGVIEKTEEIFRKHGIDYSNMIQDDKTGRRSYYLNSNISKSLAQELHNELEPLYKEALDSVTFEGNDLSKKMATNDALVKEQWSLLGKSLRSYLETTPEFKYVNEKLKSSLFGNLNKIDMSNLQSDYNGDVKKFLQSEIVIPISQLTPDVQNEISKLFDATNLKLNDYGTLVDSTLNKAFDYDKELVGKFKKKLGFEEIINESREKLYELTSIYGKGMSNLNLKDLEKAYEIHINNKNANLSFEEILQKLHQAKAEFATGIDLNVNTKLNAIKVADENRNAGADYEDSVKYAEELQKIFESGLIGTDDFKKRMEYFSPDNANDPKSYQQMAEKIKRYSTSDRSGVANFLTDLKEKGYADFDETTNKWSYNMNNLKDASKDMGMSLEWMLDMFGRLEDYGFSNNFVGNVEQGVEKLSNISVKIATAKAELAQLEAEGASSTAIEQKKAEIAQLENDLNQTQKSLDEFKANAGERYNKQISESKAAITNIASEIKRYTDNPELLGENTDEVVKKMTEEAQRIADENGITLDANLNIVEEPTIEEQLKGSVYSPTFDYTNAREQSAQFVEENSELINNMFSKFNSSKLNLNTNDLNDIEQQIFAAKYALKSFVNEDGTINLEAPGANELLTTLDMLYAKKNELSGKWVMHLPVEEIDGDLGTILQKLQEFQKAKTELEQLLALSQAGVTVDTSSAEQKVGNLISDLQALYKDNSKLFIELGLKEGSTLNSDTISSLIGGIDKKVLLDVGVPEGVIEKTQSKIDSLKDGKAKIKVSYKSALKNIEKVSDALDKLNGKSSYTTIYETTVKTTVDDKSKAPKPKSKPKSKPKKNPSYRPVGNRGYGNLNGTAHAKGTWGAKRSGRTLVGEVAPEILVDPRNGVYRTVGDNGAEFINLRKGQIIFNHIQSEELLKNGYVSSNHGRGSLVGNAFAGGYNSGGGGFWGSGVALDIDSKNNRRKKGTNGSTNGSTRQSTNNSDDNDKTSESINDFVEIAIKRLTEGINRIKILAESAFKTTSEKNNAITTQISNIVEKINFSKEAYNRYINQANRVGLDEKYASQLRNGSLNIDTITDENLSKQIRDYQEWYDKAENVRNTIMELNEEVSKLHKQSFDNIKEESEGVLNVIEHYKGMLDESIKQSEEKGYITSVKYYEALKKQEYDNIKQLEQERTSLLSSLNNAVANGNISKYSSAWYDMCNDINSVTKALEEANTALLEYSNSIREIEWEVFDKTQEQISEITDETEFLKKLMENDKQYDDKGQLTNVGKSTMGLHGVNYNVYVAQADKYKNEMLKINQALANDPYNQKLIERRKELLEKQQEMILAAQEEKQAIKDMVSEGIELELKALDELIQKFNDAIEAEKNLHDYQNSVKEQTKEIASLEKQMASYAGDTSEESQSKIQQLKVSLENAKEKLDETNYDKYISDQKLLLDELRTEYETVLNERLDNLDALISDMVTEINNNASLINTTISDKADNVGYVLSENMRSIWDTSSSNINSVISSNGVNIVNAVTTVNATLGTINTNVASMITQLNKLAQTKIEASKKTEATKTPQASGGSSSKPSSSNKPSSSSSSSGSSNGGWGSWFIRKRDGYPKSRLQINSSIVDRLKYFDFDSSMSARQKYFYAMGGSGRYIGTDSQNIWMIKQMKAHGYKNGVFNLKRDEFAWTQEGGKEELFIRPDGGVATLMQQGTSVLNSEATKNLYDFVNNPSKFINGLDGYNISSIKNGKGDTYYNYDIDIPIDHVDDFNDLVDKMKASKRFENVVTSMTTSRLSGGSRMNKYKY